MNTIHRDIFSGMVAEEMEKDGAFGKEIERYSFYVREKGETRIERADSELEAVEKLREFFKSGCAVSDFSHWRERVYTQTDGLSPEQEQAANEKLAAEQLEAFNAKVARIDERAFVDKTAEVKELLKTLTNPSAIRAAAAICYSRKRATEEILSYAAAEAEDAVLFGCYVDDSNGVKTMHGFAYVDGDKISTYVNAYLPRVWERWHEKHNEGMVMSPITDKDYAIEQNKPEYLMKDTFKEFLLKQYSPAYFETLAKILS